MARVTEPFADEVHCMKVLYQDYNRRNDAEAVASIDRDLSDVVQACTATEADVRQNIKELSRQVQELEGAAAYPYRDGLHAERVAALRRQIDMAKQVIGEMDVQARSAEQQCEEVEERLREATAAAQAVADASNIAMATLKGQRNMYVHITRTQWNDEDKPNISGKVSDIVAQDIRHFNYPPDMDKFELINKLWDLL